MRSIILLALLAYPVWCQCGPGQMRKGGQCVNTSKVVVRDANGNVAIVTTLPSEALVTVTGTTLTLAATHNGKILLFTNGAAITLTVPAGLGTGFSCQIVQMGAGQVTPTVSSTTLLQADALTKTRKQYSRASLLAVAVDTLLLDGDLQ